MSDNPEQRRILNLYGLFGASIVLSIVPYIQAAVLSTVFFIVLLAMAYVLRRGVEAESLQENHATYVIRTLWITAFFSLITMTIATAYMMGGVDYGPFMPCTNQIAGMGMEALEAAGIHDIYPIIEPCVTPFVDANKVLLMNCVVIAGAPLMIYMGYRFTKGVMRAMKGYRLANSKGWF